MLLSLQLTGKALMDRPPSYPLGQSWELMLTVRDREFIALGCLLGRLHLMRNWLRKSTFELRGLLPLTANSLGANARVYRALGGLHLWVRGFSLCWQGLPWQDAAGSWGCWTSDDAIITSFSEVLCSLTNMQLMML